MHEGVGLVEKDTLHSQDEYTPPHLFDKYGMVGGQLIAPTSPAERPPKQERITRSCPWLTLLSARVLGMYLQGESGQSI